MGKSVNFPKPHAVEPISLTDAELGLMMTYLQRFNSASQAIRSAQESLEAIAKTISGRAGGSPEQKYRLDLKGKQLIPV